MTSLNEYLLQKLIKSKLEKQLNADQLARIFVITRKLLIWGATALPQENE
jgi:hypothetical protein